MRKLSLALVVILCLTSLLYPLNHSQSALSTQSVVLWSVEEDVENISGCTNLSANNYDVKATTDDGSCDFDLDDDGILDADEITGCMNHIANNYRTNATDDDGSCDWDLDDDGILDVYEIKGCMNINATNYNPNATDEDGTCEFLSNGGFQLAYVQKSFKSITVNDYDIYSIKFSPDGVHYATQHQSKIIIWNTSTRLDETSFQVVGEILDFDWSPNGKQIATMTSHNYSNWLDTYDLETQEITYFRIGQYSHNGDLEYSPDGSMIAVSYNLETSVYNLSDNEFIGSIISDEHYGIHHSVSWNPSGSGIAFSNGGTVNVYNVPELTEEWHSYYHGHSDIESASYSADGSMIISCTENGDVVLRNAVNGYMMWEYTGYSSTIATSCTDIAWSPDLSEVAVSYSDYGYLSSSAIIFSVEDGTLVDRIGAMQSYHCIRAASCSSVNGIDWHKDGDIVLTMNGENAGIYHWEFNQNLNVIFGCSNSAATNDDPVATRDNGSCYFSTVTNNQNPGYDYGGGGYSGGGYSGGGHSGTDIGFPAITDSNGGMGYLGPSGEEIFQFCCLPLIIFLAVFSMFQNSNKTKKLKLKDGDDKPKSKDKKMQ